MFPVLYGRQARLAILKDRSSPEHGAPGGDPYALALAALGWVLADEHRADRLLALTGLTPDALRGGLGDPGILGAVLEFLGGYEPDLVAAGGTVFGG